MELADVLTLQAEFREEVRSSFRDVSATLSSIDNRTRSLETTRSQEEAVRQDRRDRDQRATETLRWKIGAALALGSAITLFIGNILPLLTR
jgi:hypothetical protein